MSQAAIAQLQLRLQYQDLVRRGLPLPSFADVEFQCQSQNGEDGLLWYVFSLLGTTNRRVVELCAGDGVECNAANLILNHGWEGLLIDGDGDAIARGRAFYAADRRTWVAPPTLVHAWLTREEVDPLVAGHGFAGPIDLLSLDVDGNDYWIWKALTSVTPRIVILEFNAACGPTRRVAMSYKSDYRLDYSANPVRCGASLAAFVALGRRKGYRLVGVQRLGFNAVFVRDGEGEDLLPVVTPEHVYTTTERLVRAFRPELVEQVLNGPEPWEEV